MLSTRTRDPVIFAGRHEPPPFLLSPCFRDESASPPSFRVQNNDLIQIKSHHKVTTLHIANMNRETANWSAGSDSLRWNQRLIHIRSGDRCLSAIDHGSGDCSVNQFFANRCSGEVCSKEHGSVLL